MKKIALSVIFIGGLIIQIGCSHQVANSSIDPRVQMNSAATSSRLICDYNDPNKSYIKKEKPCVINFLCLRDRKAFSDECGCGCEVIKPEVKNDDTNKHACTSDQKANDICYQLYKPVCGWFGQNVQCFKYPCAQIFTNNCYACQNKNVEYWTDGGCPK